MPTLLEKYQIDMSPVHHAEALLGVTLPDLLAPVRTIDADVDAIRAQIDEYLSIADEIEQVTVDLTAIRSSYALEGETAEEANGVWDVVLAILKAIAGVIVFLVGVLLLVVGALIRVIAELFNWIAEILNWVQEIILALLTGVLAWIYRGSIPEIIAALLRIFNKRALGIISLVGLASGLIGKVCEVAGKGVMWLGYTLMEFGARLSGDDRTADGVRTERDKVWT